MTIQTCRLRPWLASLVVSLLICGVTGLHAEDTPRSDHLLQVRELIRSFAQAEDILPWLEHHRSELTAESLTEVDKVKRTALQAGNLNLASVAAHLVSVAKLDAGDRRGSLAAYTQMLDIQFNLASTIEAYEDVREAARRTASMAASIDAGDLGFQIFTIAADAGYFATQTETLQVEHRSLLEAATLEDLTSAARLAPATAEELWLERFVSLTGAVLNEAFQKFGYSGDERRRQELLRELATVIEPAIPPDFRYHKVPEKVWSDSIQIQSVLAELSYRFGRPEAGSIRLLHAIKDARDRGEHEVGASLSFQRYQSERDSGRAPMELAAELEELLGVAEVTRERHRSRAGRLWAAAQADLNHTNLVKDQLMFAETSLDRTFHQVESLKTRLLLDQLSVPFRPLQDPTAVSRAADLEHQILGFPECLHNHDDMLIREMLLASRQPIAGPLRKDEQQARYVEELEALYASEQAGFAGIAPLPQISDIRAVLGTDEALIEYFIPYHPLHPTMDLWIFIITRDRVALERVPRELLERASGMIGSMSVDECPPLDSVPIVDEIALLRNDLQRSDEAAALPRLKALHELLIEPVIRAGFDPERFARWIVVPHGPLHFVPFAALTDQQGRFLIQRVAIALNPSAAVWLHEQQRKRQSPRQLVALVSPVLTDMSLPALPFFEKEDRTLLETALPDWHIDLLTGVEATERELEERTSRAGLIYFSTHGGFPERDAIDFHEVLLASEGADDGRLQAHEIRALDLSKTALVILEICNGGLYNVGPSDEPYGLIPSFLAAGAGGVVGTLWPLEAEFGRAFTNRFYADLDKYGTAMALRRTMEHFIKEDEQIRRWASFVAIGPGRPFHDVSAPPAQAQ